MPSPKMIAWIVGLSLATIIGLDHYRSKGAPGPLKKAQA